MPLVTGIETAAGVPLTGVMDQGGAVTPSTDIRTCDYTHFDLSTEQLGMTQRYNCWGFTFLPRKYWLGRSDVDQILQDNCTPVAPGSLRPGDVIRYQLQAVTTHTGRVWRVDALGNCELVRSKWGSNSEKFHAPYDVPGIYGTEHAYFRQHSPLRGISDLFIKDSPIDTGEQYNASPFWTSPDIIVDAPPYGSTDVNPTFGVPNRVWVNVHNRTDEAIDNVYVRYYWADPSAGLPPNGWHLIPGSSGHPNPAGPFSIPGMAQSQAPYVEWTPTAAPAHQCLLAMAYINDDPKDSNNPDPLVYPFDVRWDNNIGQRNVTVVEPDENGNSNHSINIGIPFDKVSRVQCTIKLKLRAIPRFTVSPIPKVFKLPRIQFSLDVKRNKTLLRKNFKSRLEDQLTQFLDRKVDWKKIRRTASVMPAELLRFSEITVATAEMRDVILSGKRPKKLHVAIKSQKKQDKNLHYYLHIEQWIDKELTGGYTFLIPG